MTAEFVPFPKIGRLKRGCVTTEKIDGSNACVVIGEDGTSIHAQSRTRIITPGKTTDNYGFAAWVDAYREELLLLGPGYHYGEWWGLGINRGYGQKEKRFSLFNVERWRDGRQPRPACCGVVPILYEGAFCDAAIDAAVEALRAEGSIAAPGFMNPEGVVVFHGGSRTMFKVTLENDEMSKGEAEALARAA